MLKRFCKNAIQYCAIEYGTLKDKPIPSISFTEKMDEYGLYRFARNRIYINLKKHIEPEKCSVNLLEISNTITHEYQHYLQDYEEYQRQLDVAYKQSSKKIPEIKYERIAYHIARRDQEKCFEYSINLL